MGHAFAFNSRFTLLLWSKSQVPAVLWHISVCWWSCCCDCLLWLGFGGCCCCLCGWCWLVGVCCCLGKWRCEPGVDVLDTLTSRRSYGWRAWSNYNDDAESVSLAYVTTAFAPRKGDGVPNMNRKSYLYRTRKIEEKSNEWVQGHGKLNGQKIRIYTLRKL